MNRKQNKMSAQTAKRIMLLVSAAVLTLAIITGSVLLLVLQRPRVSELERRELATLPGFSLQTLLTGEYTRAVSAYYEDAVPMRDRLTTLSAAFVETFGIRLSSVKFHGVIAPVAEEQTADTTERDTTAPAETGDDSTAQSTADTTTVQTEPVTTAEDTTQGGTAIGDEGIITNGILVINHRAIMLYGGGYQSAGNYAEMCNSYAAAFGGAKVYSMYIPTAVTYYLPEKYASYTYSQREHADYIRGLLTGAVDVDIFSALEAHKNEEIYLRTDHHWAPLGAYYAAQVFAGKAGVPFLDLSTYEKVSMEGYVGSMYAFTEDMSLYNNPETFVYYKAPNAYTAEYYAIDMTGGYTGSLFFNVAVSGAYCSFLGTDEIIAHITTDVGNGRVLTIIKDSYGNALVPFLTGSFSEIWVVDMRYFELNITDFVKEHGVTDVLVGACGFTCAGTNQAHLTRIFNN